MTQTNAIIERIREDAADEFERLFREEELPIWQDFIAQGKFLSASLTRVEFGNQGKAAVRDYILHVEVPGMPEHEAHDSDPRFQAFLAKAKQLQPEEPLVWGGTKLIQV